MVNSPNTVRDFFDIVTGEFKEDTWTPILFIIYLDYILTTSIDLIKENGIKLKKKWYHIFKKWYAWKKMVSH